MKNEKLGKLYYTVNTHIPIFFDWAHQEIVADFTLADFAFKFSRLPS